ncbi:DUF1194 domain-containing protein [Kaistia geumhonensis]|uniref:DUF1194 domain-containing protein n=1 Tax=Kaistia geumhonensis TaxID=410839 RepID=A0ABU0MBK5_9HYPH|nr:DUF1194 domain-containing protein [Kaistia geumhonensis]MCX5481288.1 DUF1194 domain-containing protein [Kaistia geumhonensis]MDQ0518349.1 hypothetical protein [Kaistia geumhonensis]
MASFLCLLAILAALASASPARAADDAVDVELVLAVDVSRSMDVGERELQRQGYRAALRHPDVIGAIRSGLHGRIALTYVEWSGPGSESVVVPWRLVEDEASAAGFASAIGPADPSGRFGTSISSILIFAATLFENNGFAGERLVIDVSGDGPNNSGLPVEPARDAVLARGIVVNGLPIVLRPGGGFSRFDIADLDLYYRDCVVGGPGAFTITVTSTDEFETAIRRKLIQEIAATKPRLMLAAADAATGGSDCMIGERLRQNWMGR